MASTLRLTGLNGGNSIISANDTIAANQTFEFPTTGGTFLTTNGQTTNNGTGGSAGNAEVVGYQQGLWVPDLGVLTPGTSSFTANAQNGGVWCRIGNLITLTGNLAGTWTVGTGAGQAIINGLPYSCRATPANGGYGNAYVGYHDGVGVPGNRIFDGGVIVINTSRIALYLKEVNQAGGPSDVVNGNNIVGTANGVNIHFSATYFTANTDWTPINGATVS